MFTIFNKVYQKSKCLLAGVADEIVNANLDFIVNKMTF